MGWQSYVLLIRNNDDKKTALKAIYEHNHFLDAYDGDEKKVPVGEPLEDVIFTKLLNKTPKLHKDKGYTHAILCGNGGGSSRTSAWLTMNEVKFVEYESSCERWVSKKICNDFDDDDETKELQVKLFQDEANDLCVRGKITASEVEDYITHRKTLSPYDARNALINFSYILLLKSEEDKRVVYDAIEEHNACFDNKEFTLYLGDKVTNVTLANVLKKAPVDLKNYKEVVLIVGGTFEWFSKRDLTCERFTPTCRRWISSEGQPFKMDMEVDTKKESIVVEAVEDDTTRLENKMLKTFIIPNYYLPEHFDIMDNWNENKVEKFKEYMTNIICSGGDDFLRNFIEETAQNFLEEYQEDCNDDNSDDNTSDDDDDLKSKVFNFYFRKEEGRPLSNFYTADVEIDGRIYSSGEHAFQGSKFYKLSEMADDDKKDRKDELKEYASNFEKGNAFDVDPPFAKLKGSKRGFTLTTDELDQWDGLARDTQEHICSMKYLNPEVRECLKNTGDKILVHPALRVSEDKLLDMRWNGRAKIIDGKVDIIGSNELGNIWMNLRDFPWFKQEPCDATNVEAKLTIVNDILKRSNEYTTNYEQDRAIHQIIYIIPPAGFGSNFVNLNAELATNETFRNKFLDEYERVTILNVKEKLAKLKV
jgi:predicted NAD-dependent protein-ADP-ribosyltransferase YbiA (DUF1768 family)